MKRPISRSLFVFSCLLAIGTGTRASADTPDKAGLDFFEKNVRPILVARCYQCHSATASKPSAGLLLDTRAGIATGGSHGAAIVLGKPETSLLIKAVSYTDASLQMPPGGKLSDAQVAALSQWVVLGAPDPREGNAGPGHPTGMTAKARAHWAFLPVKKIVVPKPKNALWVGNPVDAFVLAKLQVQGMKPNAPAARETLIRRVTYDLTGLPPTIDEVRGFLSDRSPNAWAKVVDRLLASPRYGERWARHWLDTARYSDTRGLMSNGGKNRFEDYRYPYAWTYRDYVVQAFNQDKPYNNFLIEQIAADRLPDIQPNDPRLAALGFLTVGKRFDNPDDMIDERIDTVSKATLGLTVSCARCHDHKFDPVPTADYYSLHGIFASTIEPVEKPMLAGTFASDANADYQTKLAELETKNRNLIYQLLGEKLAIFQPKAEGYLLLASKPGRSPESFDIAKKYDLLPEYNQREIVNALRPKADDPVLGPFARLSKLPKEDFAAKAADLIPRLLSNKKRPVNALVAQALGNLHPQSIADVAKAYGALFAQAALRTPDYLRAKSTPGGLTPNVEPAMAELIEAPYPIPAAAQIGTTEQLLAYVETLPLEPKTVNQFSFAAINELRLTHPGAPGCAMVVADAPHPRDSYIHIRGDRARKGLVVPRRFLEILSGPNRKDFTEGSGRLELAQAIADPKNPLTVRVLVNRIWMNHFGQGFVRTPDDLGNQSESPSHPELLDWLSNWFVQNGWSIKKLNRLILLSNAYQESSAPNPLYASKDPGNRLLWRANLRRLDFEAMRDSMVLLTGKLDPTLGGKPVNITDEPYSYRRSIYGYVDRQGLSDLMTQFDFSDPEMPNTQRISTIVPQQALFFMNSPMSVDVARQVVARPEVTASADDVERVRSIYHILFQRSPGVQEVQFARSFLASAEKLAPDPSGRPSKRVLASRVIRRKNASVDKYAALQNIGLPVTRAPLTPLELYTQALLCSNEFVYLN